MFPRSRSVLHVFVLSRQRCRGRGVRRPPLLPPPRYCSAAKDGDGGGDNNNNNNNNNDDDNDSSSSLPPSTGKAPPLHKTKTVEKDHPDAVVTDADDEAILKAPFVKVASAPPPTFALFPWRHELDLMDRLHPDRKDYYEKGSMYIDGLGTRFSNKGISPFLIAYLPLKEPLSNVLFFREWKRDFAESASWAFTQAVAGIISNIYNVPFENIHNGKMQVKASFNAADTLNEKEEDASQLEEDQLKGMIHEKLVNLYQSAHKSGQDSLQIRLETAPVTAQLVDLSIIPFASRSIIEQNPGLRDDVREIFAIFVANARSGNAMPPVNLYREVFPLMEDLMSKTMETRGRESQNDSNLPVILETTVIAQVLIECEELFTVVDTSTGKVVQGDVDQKRKTVMHLVRLEQDVQLQENDNQSWLSFAVRFRPSGQWQITDIDDFLDGNLIV